MIALGSSVAQNVCDGRDKIVFLHGDLGAGKTTFVKGFLQGLGVRCNVTSPTYSLVTEYAVPSKTIKVYHFDLYRLDSPEDLEFMGIRDYFNSHDISLIEWPERGVGLLPKADLKINIEIQGSKRIVNISKT